MALVYYQSCGKKGVGESRACGCPRAAVWGTVSYERGSRTDRPAWGFVKILCGLHSAGRRQREHTRHAALGCSVPHTRLMGARWTQSLCLPLPARSSLEV